ncbi:hypothetical protein BDP27DRAFT_1243728, partial [Rhodocollybia butyracea]
KKIGTIQRRLAWPLHKDDTLSRSGRPTGLNIYFILIPLPCILADSARIVLSTLFTLTTTPTQIFMISRSLSAYRILLCFTVYYRVVDVYCPY